MTGGNGASPGSAAGGCCPDVAGAASGCVAGVCSDGGVGDDDGVFGCASGACCAGDELWALTSIEPAVASDR